MQILKLWMPMNKPFTIDDLIRYIYKETDAAENKQIKYSIYKNQELKQEYHSLKLTLKCLDRLKMKADSGKITAILSYSNNINTFGDEILTSQDYLNN
jgi:hypothetical protein